MNYRKGEIAIDRLVAAGMILPHGVFPGSMPGGQSAEIFRNETNWNNYQWNPPQYLSDSHPDVDPDAARKPTWNELVAAAEAGAPDYLRSVLIDEMRTICRDLITAAYGEDAHHKEVDLRLGGRHLEEHDTERERLRARYTIIKDWINSTDRTLEELESLDLTDDANWSSTEWPPVRGGL